MGKQINLLGPTDCFEIFKKKERKKVAVEAASEQRLEAMPKFMAHFFSKVVREMIVIYGRFSQRCFFFVLSSSLSQSVRNIYDVRM